MPTTFNYTTDELMQLSEEQLRSLDSQISELGPQQGTPIYALYKQVGALADAAFIGNFESRTDQFKQGASDLANAAEAAAADLQKLNQGAQILDGVTKVVGYIDQAVQIAAKVAPLLALSQPGTIISAATNANNGGYYGWVRDLPDYRDLLFSDIRKIKGKLPPAVDLRSGCSPVENQLALNSCTANALVGALEFLQIKFNQPHVDLSRLFLYYNERSMEGSVGQDKGARIRDGVKCLKQAGICSEDLWPYDVSKVFTQPAPACYSAAVSHQLIGYYAVRSLDDMKASLAEGFPVVFGFAVFAAFESQQVAKTGILNYPDPSEAPVGGHAILAVGYNDKSQRLIIRNSWSWDWGQHGYFTMPYEYAFGGAGKPALGSDFWTLRKTES